MKKHILFLLGLFLGIVSACQKDTEPPVNNPPSSNSIDTVFVEDWEDTAAVANNWSLNASSYLVESSVCTSACSGAKAMFLGSTIERTISGLDTNVTYRLQWDVVIGNPYVNPQDRTGALMLVYQNQEYAYSKLSAYTPERQTKFVDFQPQSTTAVLRLMNQEVVLYIDNIYIYTLP